MAFKDIQICRLECLLTRRVTWQLDARHDARECGVTQADSRSGTSVTIERDPK